MPCVASPVPTLPSLPAGLSLAAPIPSFSPPTATLPSGLPCCSLPQVPSFSIPNPFGPLVINPGVVTALAGALAAMESFLDALPLACPRV